jgi:hypothetical protein
VSSNAGRRPARISPTATQKVVPNTSAIAAKVEPLAEPRLRLRSLRARILLRVPPTKEDLVYWRMESFKDGLGSYGVRES